jgi:hypothetical protein
MYIEIPWRANDVCTSHLILVGMFCDLPGLIVWLQLGGFAFIGEGIPVGLGAAYAIKYRHVCIPCMHPHVGNSRNVEDADHKLVVNPIRKAEVHLVQVAGLDSMGVCTMPWPWVSASILIYGLMWQLDWCSGLLLSGGFPKFVVECQSVCTCVFSLYIFRLKTLSIH